MFCPPLPDTLFPVLAPLSLPSLVGTYNNQYMVVDMSKITLGKQIEDWALTVVEQIPGLVEYSDQTQALRRGQGLNRLQITPHHITLLKMASD